MKVIAANEDYDQFIFLDIEDKIETYDNYNRPIYQASTIKDLTVDDYIVKYENSWMDAIPSHTIGLFIVGITLYIVF